MAWKPCLQAFSLAALAAGSLVCAVPSAKADEAVYCITCANPDQTYVCRVAAGGSKPSDALKLYCVMRTAKEGHHASCTAETYSPACNGVSKLYSYDGPMPEDIASNPHIKHLTDKIEQNQKAFEKPKGDAPQTLVALTRQGWRNARNRFGGSSQPTDQLTPDNGLALTSPRAPLAQSPVPLAAEEAAPLEEPNRMQRASSAVGGFARKSYRCVISLFRNCSGDTAAGDAPH